ncbi:MAG: PHP domain-containing protein [Tannerellaceae bacterium]|nr:PHP domain-containing protein [Tannerellaceae bacterium]
MKLYKADLHIHTCLSPCGSLEMGPACIVEKAIEKGLDAIAITDHNTTLQVPAVQVLGHQAGITVFAGVEVTTHEEAHCIALFDTNESRLAFQAYLDNHLPHTPNDPERFGDQVWVNTKEEIEGEIPWLLLSAIDQNTSQIATRVAALGGLFIAAHVERPSFSLISQLGFIDPSLPLDAIEYTHPERFRKLKPVHTYLNNYATYSASDAHYPEQIGTNYALWQTEVLTFEHLRMAFQGIAGHTIYSNIPG